MRALLPAPVLSAAILVGWLLLNQTLAPGHLLLGAVLAVALPLADRPVTTTLSGMSILGVPNGGDILIDWAFENRLPSVVNATVEAVVALDSGFDAPWIPQIPLDLPPSIGFGLQLWLPTPPLPASELGFLQKFTVRLRDAATQQLLDESYVYYQPR